MKLTNPYQQVPGLTQPVKVGTCPSPEIIEWNSVLARDLGLNLDATQQLKLASGQGKDIRAVALAYAGHQFGQFVPQLGDGRAHLLGTWTDPQYRVWDIQLKGSGATPFSRGGDGWCALGPALREYIMSEALHRLHIATARTLAVATTGQAIMRQEGFSQGAIVTRVAHSHIRIGSFQYFAARQQNASLQALMELAITRHYPDIVEEGDARVVHFFKRVMRAQMSLIIDWMRVGFIHGVMNTDNILIGGETIDYGPCAMMNQFNFQRVFSSIDHEGRYAYGQQPSILHWNLARFAECLLPIMDASREQANILLMGVLEMFASEFNQQFMQMWMNKLGLLTSDGDQETLIQTLLEAMQAQHLDFTNTFDTLTQSLQLHSAQAPIGLKSWFERWYALVDDASSAKRLARMQAANPRVIPRNHVVETIIAQVKQNGESPLLIQLMAALQDPYHLAESDLHLQDVGEVPDEHYQTFCGT